jgi:hypothetical protein
VSGPDNDRAAQLSPLGPQRLRLLDCLGGNTRLAPGYFSPPPGADILEAFARYVTDLSARWVGDTDPLVVTLLAAARLLTGDAAAARFIVDRLPATLPKLDHGAGFCLITPQQVLAATLPLPPQLADIRRWLADSPEQNALRAWLDQHQTQLHWAPDAAVYRLAEATSAPFR